MSYDHIVPKIEQLQAEVDAMLAEAEAVDQAEDEAYGEDRRGDEIAPELARRESRLQKLRAAKEALEAEAPRRPRRLRVTKPRRPASPRRRSPRPVWPQRGRRSRSPPPSATSPTPKAE